MGVPKTMAAGKDSEGRSSDFTKPARCVRCGGNRLSWKDKRLRSATVIKDGEPEYRTEIPTRRVLCADCNGSWTLQPSGLLPRKHYQPCVAAAAVSAYLFEPAASEQTVADRFGCSRRQIGRWLGWISGLATPAELQAQVAAVAAVPLLPKLPEVEDLERKAPTAGRRQLLAVVATVLALLEVLGMALGLEPPGLRGVLLHHSAGWRPVAPYGAPALPILARRNPPVESRMLTM